MILSRRKLITGLVAFVAAPAVIRVASLMPVSVQPQAIDMRPGALNWVDGDMSEYLKARDDQIILGNSALLKRADGSVKHIPLQNLMMFINKTVSTPERNWLDLGATLTVDDGQ